jgi:hypothetical protein
MNVIIQHLKFFIYLTIRNWLKDGCELHLDEISEEEGLIHKIITAGLGKSVQFNEYEAV